MTSRERKLVEMILSHEGYYSFIPCDGGGETYAGISRRYNPSWKGWSIIDRSKPLKRNQKVNNPQLVEYVNDFYDNNYCVPLKLYKITNNQLAGHLICHAVNAGIGTAVKMLQRAINKVYGVSISVDGVIGNTTLSYVNGNRKTELIKEYICQREQYYRSIIKRKPSQIMFLKGWLNRIRKTTDFCNKI